ncbi:MAG: leucine-rich repeat domain-containing protein [Eubacteriales bacterium]
MKKIFAFLVAVLIFICTLPACDVTHNESGLEYIVLNGEIVIKSYKDLTTRRKLVVPDEIEGKPVTRIDKFGIANAESLLIITIGKNVREVDNLGIVNNPNLFKFEVNEKNKYLCAIDGVLFNKNRTKLIVYPERKQEPYRVEYLDIKKYKSIPSVPAATQETDQIYIVPDGVEELAPHCFYRVDMLEKLVLPHSLKLIGTAALFQMYSLKEINFPEGLQTISRDGVSFCSSLTQIELPSTIKKLDEYAFFDCRKVKTVTVKAVKSQVEQGNLWYPTDNGKEMPDLHVVWLNG